MSHVHLVGVGGAGQNALADILVDMGYTVSGSDLKLSATTDRLAKRGVTIFEGHNAANVSKATLIVTTAAAQADNVELQAAAALDLPILQNSQMIGLLFNPKHLLAVAGTHGKTTTTGLVALLLTKAGLAPTYYVGGVLQNLQRAGQAGTGEFGVVEADEYARRFLHYQPEAAVITNLEADHLDYYGSFEVLKQAFVAFARQVKQNLYLCVDDLETAKLSQTLKVSSVIKSYGLGAKATWRATDLSLNSHGGYDFKLSCEGQVLGTVNLALPGLHNVRNALGALAMTIEAVPNVAPQRFCDWAGQYHGTARRFELKGEINGITVIDDYAHHPTEIQATLEAARARYGNRRLIALFQPHTYSRTKALLSEFAESFGTADRVALMEIFASRETDTLGVSSADLLNKIKHNGCFDQPLDHSNAAVVLGQELKEGDVLLTLGAGDVWKVGEQILGKGVQ